MGKEEQERNIQLAQLVEQHQVLYRTDLPDYANKHRQDQVWEAIAELLNDTGANCRERWKNLRLSLCRYLRSAAHGANGRKLKPYYMFPHMSFVVPYIRGRLARPAALDGPMSLLNASQEGERREKVGRETVLCVDKYTRSGDYKVEIIKEDPDAGDYANVVEPSDCYDGNQQGYYNGSRSPEVATPSTPPSTNSVLPCGDQAAPETMDGDLHFLHSLLPDMKLLDARRKMQFKIQVITLMNELLFSDGLTEVLPHRPHNTLLVPTTTTERT
ncbi:uncharacterized protein [Procambarus clarkii]|uniref:uncharacterized protein n=1 Tax=Procambarus clarkii TaxID=6728 RepID=UPI001E678DA0|nr:uncharacterized protein LOC123749925 [Procambarus clarkii]